MSNNPYESPEVQASLLTPLDQNRLRALHSIRFALGILLVPAIYNFLCFNFSLDVSRIEVPFLGIYRTVNTIGFLVIVASIWFFGLTAFEFITGGIHAIAARKSKLDDWKESLYDILRRAPFFAVPGAVLWTIWVLAFYQIQLDFFTVSVPIGIAAHILAACLYVPLIYRWYKIERLAVPRRTT